MDNWDDLKFVLAVARDGGLSGAARALNVNHSTVSRRLSALEERLGTRLFERLPQGLVPTEAGSDAIVSAEKIEAELFALDTRIAGQDTELEGPLRVTAAQLIFEVQLAEIVARFAEMHPRIDVTMIAANEVISLQRREADVAVRVSDAPDETLFGRLATGQRRGLFAARDYVQALKAVFAEPEDPAPVKYIAFKWWGTKVPRDIAARFPNASVSVVSDDMIALQAAARAGMGLARLPCFLGDPDPDLVRVPGFELQRYLDIWILTHPDLKRVERIRRFMSFAADGFKARSDLYLGG